MKSLNFMDVLSGAHASSHFINFECVFNSTGVLLACMSVITFSCQYTRRPEESVRMTGTGMTESCDIQHRYLESIPGSLEEQSVLSGAEQSFQP